MPAINWSLERQTKCWFLSQFFWKFLQQTSERPQKAPSYQQIAFETAVWRPDPGGVKVSCDHSDIQSNLNSILKFQKPKKIALFTFRWPVQIKSIRWPKRSGRSKRWSFKLKLLKNLNYSSQLYWITLTPLTSLDGQDNWSRIWTPNETSQSQDICAALRFEVCKCTPRCISTIPKLTRKRMVNRLNRKIWLFDFRNQTFWSVSWVSIWVHVEILQFNKLHTAV